MLQFCGTNILPLVWDSIVEILETLDENYEDQAVLFLRVLHHLMLAIARWYPSQPKQPRRTHCIIEKLDPERLVATLLQRHQQRLTAENFDDESTPEGNDLDDEAAVKMAAEDEKRKEEKNEQKEVPQHIKAVKEVLQRAKNLLGLQAPRMAMLALDIITQGCANLVDHENELLPMIHQVWDPFKQRFCEQNKLVVIKAVKSLHKMCSLCGDFIRKRVEKDILPALLPFLLKQAGTSFGSGVAYQHTLNFKLQNTLLTTLGDIAYMVELDEVVLEKVIDSSLPYLSQHQPQKLQEACVTCMKQLALCNVDLLWFRLSGLYTPSVPEPPSQHFLPVKVFNSMISNEYSKNVNLLMCYLDSVNGQSTTEGMR